MSNIFKTNKAPQPIATGVNIQSSVYGKPLPIVYGTTKIAGNLLLYGNFLSATSGGGGGGGSKGNLFGSSGSPETIYQASLAFALCEGPIAGIGSIWQAQKVVSLADINLTMFLGTYPQTPWDVIVSWTYVDDSGVTESGQSSLLGYNGIAYVASSNYQLGNSTSLPNNQFEVVGLLAQQVAGLLDADPSLVLKDFLTNGHYGLGFSSALIGNLTQWQTYCIATGMFVSPAYTDQRSVSDMIDELMLATNSACFWSGGLLQVTPYGDQTINANGVTFTPNLTPIYSLGDDDFMRSPQNNVGASASAGTAGPVLLTRKRKSDTINSIKVEYLDRNFSYNPAVAYANNQAEIDAYGKRTNGSAQLHLFCNATSANLSANLQLRRQLICNTYSFDLDQRYILLDPMDIIEITDSALGLSQQLVRVVEIDENDDGSLSFRCEEVLVGTGGSPLYTFGSGTGPLLNKNFPPGSCNAPIIFEPTDELGNALIPGGGLMLACAVSGQVPSTWGGCNVFVSYDGEMYSQVGTLNGQSRMGVTTADLGVVGINVTGQTVDTGNTLSVDLTQSAGALSSGTTADALALNTRCYVGGEIIAYQLATLTATSKYNLTYLVRAAYGTEDELVDHPIGTKFARLDNNVFAFSYDQSRIGSTIQLKFQGFNPLGGGTQSLVDCAPFSYTITGAALSSPLPDVENLYVNYEAGFEKIYWDQIEDFRNGIFYEIRQGLDWDHALPIRIQAHPPFIAQGNGTFLIKARCQPVAGLIVYSETASEIIVAGNQLSLNLLATWDEQATGWSGTLDAGLITSGGNLQFATKIYSDTTVAATASGSNLSFASISANVQIGYAIEDVTTGGVIPASTVVQTITVTNLTDYGSIATAFGASVDYGAINVGATAFIDYGNFTDANVIVGMNFSVTGGGVLNGDMMLFFQPLTINTPFYYTIPASHIIHAGSVVQASVNATTLVVGTPIQQNILTEGNILDDPDILGSISTQYVDGWVEINLSQDNGVTWGGWQKFVPGVFPASDWNLRLALETADGTTLPQALAFSFSVQLPSRIDHYQNQTVPSAGLTITFQRDGVAAAAPFNGGPAANGLPYYSVAWQATTGDTFTITGLSLSQLTINFFNSVGGAVQRTGVNITVEGY